MKVNSHLEDIIYKLYQQIGIYKLAQLNTQVISNAMGIKLFYWERTRKEMERYWSNI